ncbi:TetR/AcrR family transcriptional regulator [Parenemella sanctibonifatiensis]|uniref:TetR family transcriptional regulator n=1 Tax=Parenemella sanctibonifatiensis TaxID=2016505 RepID=A0A255EKH1_9ACTN|nr:TetR/AcrR family transcriptional regulator [Parenemella sanctibonifatiensis]OYN91994.1 TetR family transcriptional regulator [Parenemella sanctibonifatiensis]
MARTADPQRSAQRRQALVDMAAVMFAERGFEETSVADVARGAGVSPASVFYYFGDKPALFRAIFVEDGPKVRAVLDRYADRPPTEAILSILDELVADADSPLALGLVIELMRRVRHDSELLAVVEATDATTRDELTRHVARGIAAGEIDPALDPAETAAWLQSLCDGCFLSGAEGGPPAAKLRRTVAAYLAVGVSHG